MSGRSIDANAAPLTDETLAAVKGAYAVLLGGPELGTGAVRPQKGLLKLRKRMGTYGGLRPYFLTLNSLVDASPCMAWWWLMTTRQQTDSKIMVMRLTHIE
ncbi:3-isopropylmalate dehydrogenase [Fusarium mexicanum]|uniref:3-isopropylmalate dehydrogenase n=1 Tax=Fusarium mexicanum TaxID=751941 RepID=A0A8H5IER9_9HYPO|nr:3-isopropylmalate dehydrogenase [Fusarium mexicanum]